MVIEKKFEWTKESQINLSKMGKKMVFFVKKRTSIYDTAIYYFEHEITNDR